MSHPTPPTSPRAEPPSTGCPDPGNVTCRVSVPPELTGVLAKGSTALELRHSEGCLRDVMDDVRDSQRVPQLTVFVQLGQPRSTDQDPPVERAAPAALAPFVPVRLSRPSSPANHGPAQSLADRLLHEQSRAPTSRSASSDRRTSASTSYLPSPRGVSPSPTRTTLPLDSMQQDELQREKRRRRQSSDSRGVKSRTPTALDQISDDQASTSTVNGLEVEQPVETKLERPTLHTYTSFQSSFELEPPPSPPGSPKAPAEGKGWWRSL